MDRAPEPTSGDEPELLSGWLQFHRDTWTAAALLEQVATHAPVRDLSVEEPAIEARVTGATALPLGEEVEVRLETADVVARKVSFTID